MLPISEATYIVTDVETTGSNAVEHRIIEIACVVVQGGEVIDQVHSLINPHQFISPFISALTGITNADVWRAPEETDVLPVIADLFKQPNAVFVAHHAQFDWRFLTNALMRCGLSELTVPRVCTYRLARRLLPPEIKKNLGAIAEHFGININNRHRANGDAMATARILLRFLEELAERFGVESLDQVLAFQWNRNVKDVIHQRVRTLLEPQLQALPSQPGAYMFFDRQDNLLYIGKAKQLDGRVRSYFHPSAPMQPHIEQMIRRVRRIEWIETATELGALIAEADLISRHQPPFNTHLRRLHRYPFLHLTSGDFPYLEVTFEHNGDGEYFGPFPNRGVAYAILEELEGIFRLRRCYGELKPSVSARPCFYYHLHRCNAPCALLQSQSDYKREVERVRELLHGNAEWFLTILQEQMHQAAEQLNFEHAQALLQRLRLVQKLISRLNTPSISVTHFNVALLLPTAYEKTTVELFIFLCGRLVFQQVMGRKASLDFLIPLLDSNIQNGMEKSLTPEQTRTLRIVTDWMYRNHGAYQSVVFNELESKHIVECIARGLDEFHRDGIPATCSDAKLHHLSEQPYAFD